LEFSFHDWLLLLPSLVFAFMIFQTGTWSCSSSFWIESWSKDHHRIEHLLHSAQLRCFIPHCRCHLEWILFFSRLCYRIYLAHHILKQFLLREVFYALRGYLLSNHFYHFLILRWVLGLELIIFLSLYLSNTLFLYILALILEEWNISYQHSRVSCYLLTQYYFIHLN
jgi:hypothetical protein